MVDSLATLPLTGYSLLSRTATTTRTTAVVCKLEDHTRRGTRTGILFMSRRVFPRALTIVHAQTVPRKVMMGMNDCGSLAFAPSVFNYVIRCPGGDKDVRSCQRFARRTRTMKYGITMTTSVLSLTLLIPPNR